MEKNSMIENRRDFKTYFWQHCTNDMAWPRCINPNHPKSIKILQGAVFLEKFSTVGNCTFTSSNGAKLIPGKKCWIWKINENAWCILKIRVCYQKCTGWILEDSGRFLARIPQGLGLRLRHYGYTNPHMWTVARFDNDVTNTGYIPSKHTQFFGGKFFF